MLGRLLEPILVAVDERAEEHAADDAEDRGVGADSERERDDDGGGQPLDAPERAQGEADVASERLDGVEPVGAPDAPHRVAGEREVAEFLQRRQAGGGGIVAALDPILDAERQMTADFLVQVVLVGRHGPTPSARPPGS